MRDRKIIVIGLVFFILAITFPFWYTFNNRNDFHKPELTEKAKSQQKCVMPKEEMASGHMKLLDFWRHSVVRNGKRIFVSYDGLEYNMSITNTCLDCHSNKTDFCDKCHDYASVEPYCWDCHIDNLKGDK